MSISNKMDYYLTKGTCRVSVQVYLQGKWLWVTSVNYSDHTYKYEEGKEAHNFGSTTEWVREAYTLSEMINLNGVAARVVVQPNVINESEYWMNPGKEESV